jgi:2-haloacid dehalogenase
MKYDLFLLDLDDTLLDFKGSERLSFFSSLQNLGLGGDLEPLYRRYQGINTALWRLFEEGKTTKEHFKTERFRKLFEEHQIEVDPFLAGERFLDALPESVVLLDGAIEICERFRGVRLCEAGCQVFRAQCEACEEISKDLDHHGWGPG